MKLGKQTQHYLPFLFLLLLGLMLRPATLPAAPDTGSGGHDNQPAGTIIYVKADATGTPNGSSWTHAYTDLQDALAAAGSGDQIWVATGTYYPTDGTDRSISFVMKNDVAIYGGFAGSETMLSQRDWVANETILSGDINQDNDLAGNSYHVIFNNNNGLNATAILDGFTVTGGNADGSSFPNDRGGGMYNNNSSPTLNNCIFQDNSADDDGGGMFNLESSPTINNCIFQDNSADDDGGGMFNLESSPTITNCTFQGNSARISGGGMNNEDSSSPTLTNCIFQGNSAGQLGGGMLNFGSSSPELTNCSFQGNSAGTAGGMINSGSSPTLTNCILWGNGSEIFNTPNSNPNVSFSIVQGGYSSCTNCPGGNGDLDPLFVDPAGGDLRLLPCSPAIDAGTDSGAPATDLDGNPRPANAGIDMGAFEFHGTPTPVVANCQNQTVVVLDAMGNGSIEVASLDDGSTGCGSLSFAVDNASMLTFDCTNAGDNPVTLTVTDNNGNSSTCSATVTVEDNNAPTAVCVNPTVNLTSDGTTIVDASFFDGGSSAVCGGLDFSASMTEFDCDDVGETYSVTLTVTSQSSGQSDNCTAIVTVADPNSFCCAPPMAQCDNITVQLDANGQASITPADIGSGSTAECGLQSESLSVSNFGCGDVGSDNMVTYTITDVNNDSDNCTATVTVEDNISPTAACLNTTVEIEPDGMYHLQQSDVFDAANSSDNCPFGPVPGLIENVSFPPTTFGCDDVGLTFPVTVTLTDPSGNSGNCTANITVGPGTALPPGWAATDIGSQGDGSDYAYDPCARKNPNRGDFTVSTGAYNLIPNNSDNLAFVGRELCNNGGIQARIEDVNGGYAGLMIRESSAPGAKMTAVYSNLTNLLRRETRTVDNGPRSSGTHFAPFPYWLRLVRQGNYIRAFYRTSDNGSWTLFHQAYLPMQECVEMGLAVFTTDPNGQADATFSRVQWQSNVGGSNNLAIFNEGPAATQADKREISVFPNPARSAFTLAFSRALDSEGIAILRNQMGQAVAQRQLQAGDIDADWDVSRLPGGLYLMEIRQEGWPPEVLQVIKTD